MIAQGRSTAIQTQGLSSEVVESGYLVSPTSFAGAPCGVIGNIHGVTVLNTVVALSDFVPHCTRALVELVVLSAA